MWFHSKVGRCIISVKWVQHGRFFAGTEPPMPDAPGGNWELWGFGPSLGVSYHLFEGKPKVHHQKLCWFLMKKRIEMQCFWDRPILGIVHICSWYLRNEMTDKDFNFGEMVRVCIVDEDKPVEVGCFLVEHVWAMQVLGNVPMVVHFPLLFLISM